MATAIARVGEGRRRRRRDLYATHPPYFPLFARNLVGSGRWPLSTSARCTDVVVDRVDLCFVTRNPAGSLNRYAETSLKEKIYIFVTLQDIKPSKQQRFVSVENKCRASIILIGLDRSFWIRRALFVLISGRECACYSHADPNGRLSSSTME